MKNVRGFSLIELLIVMFIFSIVMSAIYMTFTGIMYDYKGQSMQIKTQIENIIGLEILRADIEHAGLGIAYDLIGDPQISTLINAKGKTQLTIKSTFNSTNQLTHGWGIVDCKNGYFNLIANEIDNLSIDSSTNKIRDIVLLDVQREFVETYNNINLSRANNLNCNFRQSLIYPFDNTTTDGCTSAQFCNSINYRLSTTQTLSNCNPDTFNLLRTIGPLANGLPLINCVATMQIRIDYDANANGIIDLASSKESLITNFDGDINKNGIIDRSDKEAISNNLKRVHIFLLIQEGLIDKKYNSANDNLTIDSVTLKAPANSSNYRWKPIHMTVKPMSL